eukprot:5818496-Pyramimonas_sp.AAC.1
MPTAFAVSQPQLGIGLLKPEGNSLYSHPGGSIGQWGPGLASGEGGRSRQALSGGGGASRKPSGLWRSRLCLGSRIGQFSERELPTPLSLPGNTKSCHAPP